MPVGGSDRIQFWRDVGTTPRAERPREPLLRLFPDFSRERPFRLDPCRRPTISEVQRTEGLSKTPFWAMASLNEAFSAPLACSDEIARYEMP